MRRLLAALVVLAYESAVAWVVAWAATVGMQRYVAQHPSGAFGLMEEGGRLAADFARHFSDGLSALLAVAVVTVAAHAAMSVPLGGFLPLMGALPSPPPVHRAVAESWRRAPTLLGLSTIFVTGFALVALLTGYEWAVADHATTSWADPSAIDRRHALSLLPSLALGTLLLCWHDVARADAMTAGHGMFRASGRAAQEMLRQPVGVTLGWYGYAIARALPLALAVAAGVWLEPRRALAAQGALVAVRTLSLLANIDGRLRWFRHLGARLRGAV